MRFPPTAIRKLLSKIDASAKVKATIRIDINVQRFEICWGIDNSNVPSLDEIVCYNDVFLVWSDFDIMRSNRRLNFVGVVETFGIVDVRYVESSDMVRRRYRCYE